MEDTTQRISLTMSVKTYSAMVGFLKKHNKSSRDISRFVEDAIIWRMLDRQLALINAEEKSDVDIFMNDEEQQMGVQVGAA